MKEALVIGGGPAGLAAAEVMAQAGLSVTVADAMPSFGRKFLMAGKSGLNLTFDTNLGDLLQAYDEDSALLEPILREFDAVAIQRWAEDLGQQVFTGTSGRVFPVAMKASPLLRAWLARLDALGVTRNTRWRWTGWNEAVATFGTPDGTVGFPADVTILALGGGSWKRLGSDGTWQYIFARHKLATTQFQGSNVGLSVTWSGHMETYFGTPLKDIELRAGPRISRGEALISGAGLEGGGLYPLIPAIRKGHQLSIDLLPNRNIGWITDKLKTARKKDSARSKLRKALGLSLAKIALLHEWARPLPADATELGAIVKSLQAPSLPLRPLDEAISTVGGVPWSALTSELMLKDKPGVFCAGEMIDWDAPTGGYLLTACFATGRWAGRHAAAFSQ